MFRTRTFCLTGAVLCMLTLPAHAAQVDAGSVYCFSSEDFSEGSGLTGICITGLPESRLGALTLGNRGIRCGDILTAQQAEQMLFSPILTSEDQTAKLEYLPIYENRVAPCSAMTIHIRGREDKAPIAEDSAAETYKNLPCTGKLKASDPEEQAMIFTVTRQPKRGTLQISPDGSFTYAPKKNKVGVDSFTYTAADPAGNISREATVTITVLKPTDAPRYTDTAGRDCSFTAEWMKHTGIFVGETLGDQCCFQPDKEVTRGEFVTMLIKALDIPADECLTHTGFTDDVPQWLQPYLAAAVRSGITADLPDQETFGAGLAITGGDAMTMLGNALNTDDLPELGTPLDTEAPLTREQVSRLLYACAKSSGETGEELL